MLGKLAQACREGSLQDRTHQARRQDYKSLSKWLPDLLSWNELDEFLLL